MFRQKTKMEEEQEKRILTLRNRLILADITERRGELYLLEVLEGKYSNWNIENHIECVGTGFNN